MTLVDPAPRDDLASLFYTLLSLLDRLPWLDLDKCPEQTPETWEPIINAAKGFASVKKLCAGLPEEFTHLYKYIQTLGAHDIPDYDRCRRLMADARDRLSCSLSSDSGANSTASSPPLDHVLQSPAMVAKKTPGLNLSGKPVACYCTSSGAFH